MGNEANYTRDNANPSKNYGKVMTNAVDGDLLTQTWTAATTETWAYSSVAGAEIEKYSAHFMLPSVFSGQILPTNWLLAW